jgi:diguanylate cyclase (GGDEF)-like protein
MMQDIAAGHRPSAEMLEFLADQFNTANRETDYSATLLRLFDVYCEQQNFAKASDALDRAVEIDPYEPGHAKRLELLKGKIEQTRYDLISSRFTGTSAAQPPRNNPDEKMLGSGTLQDLMLQAEILVQYGMRNKALERLQRIQQLFPHEEERNADLRQLYVTAGMTPQYSPGSTGSVAAVAPVPSSSAASASSGAAESLDMASFARVPDITRKLNQQNTADGVLNAAATEIGTQWKLSRCVVALRKPGLVTSAAKQFACEGTALADSEVTEQVVSTLHDLAITRGTLAYPDTVAVPELQGLAQQLSALNARSLLAVPLMDGDDHLGVMLLIESTSRSWASNDVMIFKMIAEQVAIALNNAGLRRLVKNLSVTDENSGLLKRASYIDLLMGEVRRAAQQATPVTVLIMRFAERATIAKEQGEAAADNLMQRLGQLVAANVRQNDLAFRYAGNAIAIILGETGENEALRVVEKMRRLIATAIGEKQIAASFNAGAAQAVVRQQFDAVDIVTEVINRAERALEKAVAEGPGKATIVPNTLSAAAVA